MNSDPNPVAAPTSDDATGPPPTADSDTRWLREAFAETADRLTPPPFSLPVIQECRRRQVRRRRLVIALCAACVGLLVPLTVPWDGYRSSAPEPNPPAVSPTVPVPEPEPEVDAEPEVDPEPVRTVAPGERVAAGSGAEFWLTDEGKHWSTPEQEEQFRSVVDGNIDRTRPGVSFQGEGADGGTHLMSGLYYGTEDAAAVTVTTDSGTLDAHLIRLADAPDWGVWYVTPSTANADSGATVTLHDADGDPLAELELPRFLDP